MKIIFDDFGYYQYDWVEIHVFEKHQEIKIFKYKEDKKEYNLEQTYRMKFFGNWSSYISELSFPVETEGEKFQIRCDDLHYLLEIIENIKDIYKKETA